jgi:hypothetical protein
MSVPGQSCTANFESEAMGHRLQQLAQIRAVEKGSNYSADRCRLCSRLNTSFAFRLLDFWCWVHVLLPIPCTTMKIGRFRDFKRSAAPAKDKGTAVQENTSDNPLKNTTATSEPPKKRALLIGINYERRTAGDRYAALNGPHADVRAMRDLLMGQYEYLESEIVVMLDEPGGVQPTRNNIVGPRLSTTPRVLMNFLGSVKRDRRANKWRTSRRPFFLPL